MKETLTAYAEKRNPSRTPEPFGEQKSDTAEAKKPGLRFVVQLHEARRLHYDLRLEWDGVLLSWAVPKGPSFDPRDKRLAVKVEDHPLDYALFEGAIPKGEYGGGTVMLWDEGAWTPLTDVPTGLKSGELKFALDGSRLHGKWALVRMNKENENWLLIKEKDEFTAEDDGIAGYDTSVSSGRTMDEIAAQESAAMLRNPFDEINVELAKPLDKAPDEDGMLYEVKFDGYRIAAFCEQGKVRLVTRNGLDYSGKFPSITEALKELSEGRAMIFDGELVVLDDNGVSDFHALQHYARSPSGKTLSYMVFDLLALDGRDLREKPLSERKTLAEALLKDAPPAIGYSRHIEGKGAEFFEAAAKAGLEGIVGKRADSPYRGGRNGDWVKIKCRPRQEFAVGGYTRSERKAEGVSSLLLGVFDGEKLRYVGRVGSGFGEKEGMALAKKLDKFASEINPFSERVKASGNEKIFFLLPEAVAEVEYAELIEGKILRQASFKGLREDKEAKEVVWETLSPNKEPLKINTDTAAATKPAAAPAVKKGHAEVNGVKISSPDKIVYTKPKEITKLEVVEYYRAVADRMLPYAGNRILSVVRCHKGIDGDCFFKKHPAAEGEGVGFTDVTNSEGETSRYFYLREAKGLISQAQLGSLEFHVWGSRAESQDLPDMMVFDLDPDEGMDLSEIRRGAADLKGVLDSLSLVSFLKTSGGKGYHIVLPFEPSASWDAFHSFARRVAEFMEERQPERYTANIRKNKREKRIFIDWQRNGKGATGVAPYSLRARPGAKVSMPIDWSELEKVAPDGIDMFEALRRIEAADPWKGFFEIKQSLKVKQ